MNKMTTVALGLVGTMLGAVALVAGAGHEPRLDASSELVGICHATGSAEEPFVFVIVERDSLEHQAYLANPNDILEVVSERDCPKAPPSPTTEEASPLGSVAPACLADAAGPSDLCPSDVAARQFGSRDGTTMVFSLAVQALGPATAYEVRLVDNLPDVGHPWDLAGEHAADCDIAGTQLACEWSLVPKGETRGVDVRATGNAYDCGATIQNTAHVESALDPVPTNNDATAVIRLADCEVEPSPSPTPTPTTPRPTTNSPTPATSTPAPTSSSPAPTSTAPTLADVRVETSVGEDEDLTFTIVVTNGGPATATHIELTATLANLTDPWSLGGSAATNCAFAPGGISCAWSSLSSGASRTLTLTADPGAECGRHLILAAQIDSDADNNPGNDADTSDWDLDACPGLADLALEQTVAKSDTQVTFMLVVSNIGGAAATNATLTDALPDLPGASWSLGGDDATACLLANESFACGFGTVAAGSQRTVTVTSPLTYLCASVSNVASVSADQDADPDNDDSTGALAAFTTCRDTSVAQTLWSNSTLLMLNVTVRAEGPNPSKEVHLVDELPDVGSGWFLAGSDSEFCTLEGRSLACNFGDLPVGAERHVSLRAFNAAIECGATVQNTATVDSLDDVVPGNDASTVQGIGRPC